MSGRSPSRVYRIALAGPYHFGAASMEHRTAVALEKLGHLVYEFSPARQPWLFHQQDNHFLLSAGQLHKFLSTERIDLLLLADRCDLTGQVVSLGTCALIRLTTKTSDIHLVQKRSHPRFASPAEQDLITPTAVLGIGNTVDSDYATTPLANTIALQKGILCIQNGSPFRTSQIRELRKNLHVPIRCIGTGWPTDLNYPVSPDPFDTSFIYASHASRACVRFDAGSQPNGYARTLLGADDVPEIVIKGTGTSLPTDVSTQCARLLTRSSDKPARKQTSLETILTRELAQLPTLLPTGTAPGATGPRQLVTALGYVGTGNFGDEYILHTLTHRLMNSSRASGVIAISENPEHTFTHRGVYSIPLVDAPQVDHALARSGVALVLAGLLFDQGTRWTMGCAEILSRLTHSDLPGIDGFVSLARLNNVRTIFYGIGAGPLVSPDSQALVRHMGEQGSLFLTRDEESSQAIRACRVPQSQVRTDADIAFLGSASATDRVTQWLRGHHAGNRELLAISLRDYETIPKAFEQRLASALDRFTAKHPDIRPVFCLLDPADRAITLRVVNKMRYKAKALIFDPKDDLAALEDLLSRCREGISLRLHCSLVLLREGVPCAGVDYLPKVAGLYNKMGMADSLLEPDTSENQILTTLENLENRHEQLQKTIRGRLQIVRKLALRAEQTMLSELDMGMNGKTGAIPSICRFRWKPDGENGARPPEGMPPAVSPCKKPTNGSVHNVVASPLVSVIMPVYNAVDHLPQAIESILGQTHHHLQLICVDDGSTDKSLSLLRSYARNDPRVTVISEKNAGPGTARNKGLTQATGKYVTFLDADDWMDADCLQRTVSRLEETHADMAVIPHRQYDAQQNLTRQPVDSTLPGKFPQRTFTWRDNPDWIFYGVQNMPWNKMLRTDFIRRNHLRFEENVRLTEDVMFSCPAAALATSITYLDGPLVTYRMHTGTDTMAHKDIHPLDFLTAFVTLQKWLKKRELWPDLRIAYVNWALDACHFNLITLNTQEGFTSVYTTLQKHGLADLCLTTVSEKEIQKPYLRDFLHDIRTMDSDDFLTHEFVQRRNLSDDLTFREDALRPIREQQLQKEKAKQENLQKQIDSLTHQLDAANERTQAVYATTSYRIGNKLVTPVAKLRDLFRRQH